MLFIVNTSEKYREKGIQEYSVRIGSPERYSTLGNFSIKNSSSVSDILKKASLAVKSYNPIHEMFMLVNDPEKAAAYNSKKVLNIICITISNISEKYNKGGLQNYEIGIVEFNNGKIEHNKICKFNHMYEDGAYKCFEIASESIDKDIFLPSYKSFLNDRKKISKRKP